MKAARPMATKIHWNIIRLFLQKCRNFGETEALFRSVRKSELKISHCVD
jgi:hypothetical protein